MAATVMAPNARHLLRVRPSSLMAFLSSRPASRYRLDRPRTPPSLLPKQCRRRFRFAAGREADTGRRRPTCPGRRAADAGDEFGSVGHSWPVVAETRLYRYVATLRF